MEEGCPSLFFGRGNRTPSHLHLHLLRHLMAAADPASQPVVASRPAPWTLFRTAALESALGAFSTLDLLRQQLCSFDNTDRALDRGADSTERTRQLLLDHLDRWGTVLMRA